MEVFITAKRMAWVAKRGKFAILEMAYTVTEVLNKPMAIFEGIRRDSDEDKDHASACDTWLCYCGHPKMAYCGPGESPTPSRHSECFLVFVNSECVAYAWRWEACDGQGFPDGHESRFHRRAL